MSRGPEEFHKKQEVPAMELMKWEPFSGELSSFRRQIDRLFDSLLRKRVPPVAREATRANGGCGRDAG